MSESRVRENRTHGSMRRREATPDQSAKPRGPGTPPADPTDRPRAFGFCFLASADGTRHASAPAQTRNLVPGNFSVKLGSRLRSARA
jgi:hypothetical protein